MLCEDLEAEDGVTQEGDDIYVYLRLNHVVCSRNQHTLSSKYPPIKKLENNF